MRVLVRKITALIVIEIRLANELFIYEAKRQSLDTRFKRKRIIVAVTITRTLTLEEKDE